MSRSTGYRVLQLESRLKWLMFGRLAIAGICLFTTVFTAPPERVADFGYPPFFPLLAAILLNLIYLLAARAGARARRLAVLQLVLDVLIVGVLVYFTGIDRFFAFLTFAVVIAAAMVGGPRIAIAMASLAAITLAAISTLYFFSSEAHGALVLPLVGPDVIQEHSMRKEFLLPFLFFFALSLHVVALLAGRLSEEASRVRILNDEILQNMAGGVLAADRFGGIQFVNDQAGQLLGLRAPEAARGRHIDAVLPGAMAELLHQAIRHRERVAREVRVNGSLLDVAVSCLVERDGEEIRGVVAIVNDLSMRLQMEEMTLRAERFEALLQLSASMAHEIRNPLASIRGAAQELESSTLPKEEDRQLLRVMVKESDRLNKIISDFLDYASDRPTEKGLVNIAELLRETALILEARQDPVEIVRELPRSMLCQGASDRLKQVFLNLGLNALDACAHLGKKGRVVFRCLPSGNFLRDGRDGVLIEVEDTGTGMTAEQLQRAFDPFFTTKPHGTGMGLPIARRIIQGHGGEIVLESHEGKGTVVKVWLPA